MTDLLATKLHRPSKPVKWIQRQHLIHRLNEGLELYRQVTLVSAPAGFGKTTCISEWVDSLDRLPVAWLSLDPSDDDPGRFIVYFIAALQKIHPNLGKEIEGVIRSGQLPPSEIISTALINDILETEGRFLLVLDDFHVIQDRFILRVLEQLVTNSSDHLHLVLITREDPPLPLARLRANNQLTEIRARDLCFTNHETDRFLNEVMGLSLSQADITKLGDKTEGWIVGVQLAGLAMREQANPSGFIATLSGIHRFILSYLTEQVLSQQQEEIQHFLLQTSFLDKLNGDLCNVITGRSDCNDLLEQLFNANLFLIPMDDERQWYRFHHLFVDLLRSLHNSLRKDKTIELHRRASRWYAQAGMSNDAIQHALAAEDYAMAVDLLESHAMEMILQGYAKTVNGWVQVLPKEWINRSPRTNLAFAWSLLLRGDYSQATVYLEQLRSTLLDSPLGEANKSIRAEWLVMQSLDLYMQGKITECMEMANQALELLPEQDSRVRSMAYYVQASVYRLMEDYPQAVENYQKSIHLSQESENYVAEMMSTAGLAGMVLEYGQLHLAFDIASRAVGKLERSGILHPISAVIYASLGDVYCQWYQIREARRNFQQALHLSTLGGSNTITILCHVLLSRLSQIEGDIENAALESQKAIDLVPLEVPEYVRQEVVSQQIRIYLALKRPAEAEMVLQRYGVFIGDQSSFIDLFAGLIDLLSSRESISSSIGRLCNSVIGLFYYQARAEENVTRIKNSIVYADRVITLALKSHQRVVELETLLLRAQMYAVIGELSASRENYIKALAIAEPEGFIGVFVEQGVPVEEALTKLVKNRQLGSIPQGYVERILNAFSESHRLPDQQTSAYSPTRVRPVALIEPLTDRELDVLRLIAKGLKYKEIADRLFISINTVRYHVKAIYGKLNASNRLQAIELAHKHRLM